MKSFDIAPDGRCELGRSDVRTDTSGPVQNGFAMQRTALEKRIKSGWESFDKASKKQADERDADEQRNH
jgi:hypothetical protein